MGLEPSLQWRCRHFCVFSAASFSFFVPRQFSGRKVGKAKMRRHQNSDSSKIILFSLVSVSQRFSLIFQRIQFQVFCLLLGSFTSFRRLNTNAMNQKTRLTNPSAKLMELPIRKNPISKPKIATKVKKVPLTLKPCKTFLSFIMVLKIGRAHV